MTGTVTQAHRDGLEWLLEHKHIETISILDMLVFCHSFKIDFCS